MWFFYFAYDGLVDSYYWKRHCKGLLHITMHVAADADGNLIWPPKSKSPAVVVPVAPPKHTTPGKPGKKKGAKKNAGKGSKGPGGNAHHNKKTCMCPFCKKERRAKDGSSSPEVSEEEESDESDESDSYLPLRAQSRPENTRKSISNLGTAPPAAK
eukprot:g63111.t1